jgi:hypothetical protein
MAKKELKLEKNGKAKFVSKKKQRRASDLTLSDERTVSLKVSILRSFPLNRCAFDRKRFLSCEPS